MFTRQMAVLLDWVDDSLKRGNKLLHSSVLVTLSQLTVPLKPRLSQADHCRGYT
jgi:hypothetical protein